MTQNRSAAVLWKSNHNYGVPIISNECIPPPKQHFLITHSMLSMLACLDDKLDDNCNYGKVFREAANKKTTINHQRKEIV